MSQPSAKLEKLRAELEKAKDSAIEAHHTLREERRASDDNKATLKHAEERLMTLCEDLRKAMDMLDEQKVKLAKNQVALEEARRSAAESQAREGSEALQRALDESLEREGEATRRAKLLEVKLDGIPLCLELLVEFCSYVDCLSCRSSRRSPEAKGLRSRADRFLQAEGDKLRAKADLILQKV